MFKKLVQMGIQKLSGQGKTTGTEIIKNVKIAPNIDTKKAIEQKVVKTVDQAFKDADPQGVYTQTLASKKKKSKLKKDESKKLKDVSYKLDKLEEKVKKRNEGSSKLFKAFKGRKFNKGGRVGLKRGTFPDHSGDGQITQKDILMAKGVIPKPKNKKMAKKSKSPMDKAVRKS